MVDEHGWRSRFGTTPYVVVAALSAVAALGIVLLASDEFGWWEFAFPVFVGVISLLVGPFVPLSRDNRLGPVVLGVMATALLVVGVVQRL